MDQKIKKIKNTRGVRVIPGFGLTLGVTVTMLSLIVLIPLVSVLIMSFNMTFSEFIDCITSFDVIKALGNTFTCALIAALINSVFGVLLAWILVRYSFPGKRLLDGIIELPFALPTAVAGITLTNLYCDTGLIGRWFAKIGVSISYTDIGVVIAMIFIGIPFVVRAVQPVLEKLDVQYEEAASILGAGRWKTFRRVIFPEIFPAALTGFGLALARGIGEYGSVMYISGNKDNTRIVSMEIMKQLERSNYEAAAAIALLMLVVAFILLLIINIIQIRASRRTNE